MPGTPVTAKAVIIADDTPAVRDRFRHALEGAGHRAVMAGSAEEALAAISNGSPGVDLIVLNLRIPGSPGVDLVRSIRQLENGTLPILIFSGTVGSADEVRELAVLGVAGYVNEHSVPPHILPALAPHLFPDSFNRRGSPRAALGVPVQYRYGQTVAAAPMLNVSHGGIAIRTTSPLDAGARVRVRFRVPGSNRDIDVEGRVVWSDRRAGMGVQIERLTGADQTAIDDFVTAHFFANRAT
jgi:uncharacterized protein (TIGR02266 family)